MARSIAITPAEQPMPPRLYETTSARILKRLTSIAESDGVGQKSEQLTTRTPMRSGGVRVAASTSSTARNIICSASARAPAMHSATRSASAPNLPGVSGMTPSGKTERSEMHDVRSIRSWKSRLSFVKHALPSVCCARRDSRRKASYVAAAPAVFASGPPTILCRYVLKSTR